MAVARVGGEPELVDVVARQPVPDDLALPRHLDEAVVLERHVGDVGLPTVSVGEDQRGAAFDRRRGVRRVVARREAVALPVVVLARGPDGRALARLDLLGAREPPHVLPRKVALHQFQRLLIRRTRPCRGDDDTARQHARRPAGGVVEVLPALDHVAVHVDDEHGRRAERREHGVSAPRAIRVVDRRARGIDGLGASQRNQDNEHAQANRSPGGDSGSHLIAPCAANCIILLCSR